MKFVNCLLVLSQWKTKEQVELNNSTVGIMVKPGSWKPSPTVRHNGLIRVMEALPYSAAVNGEQEYIKNELVTDS